MKETINVVIPLYNHEQFIEEAINSALVQTYPVDEIIVINDGSKDNSEKIVLDKFSGEKKVKYFSQKNQGAHSTINNGIEKSSGDYIAILNSDDIFKKDKIERCINIINERENVDIVFGGVDFIDGKSNIIKKGVVVDWQQRGKIFLERSNLFSLSMLNENIISTTSNMFFRRSIIDEKIKFYPLRYCHDLDFVLSCVKTGNYYFDKDHVHISYRYHDSNTIKENIKDIQLEIAAVVSAAMVDYKTKIINENINNLQYFVDFLNNKNISKAIIYLMLVYVKNPDKNDFFDYIYQEENKKQLYSLLT